MAKRNALRDVDPAVLLTEYEDGATLDELARRYGACASTVRNWIGRAGGRTRTRSEASGFRRRGPDAVRWQGGRTRTSKGYVLVKLPADHALADMAMKSGYVLEHRLVMAQALGRALHPWEQVHHLDGDRANNALANLQLRFKPHGSGIALRCADCGSHNVSAVEV